MYIQSKLFHYTFLLTIMLIFNEAFPQGNLLITPRRVVLNGTKKTTELNLANTGEDTARFAVSFIQYRMKLDGSMEEVTVPDSGQRFADRFLRLFPRSVVLAPNEAQAIRIQLTRTQELEPGEYRSHIFFRAIPNEHPLGETPILSTDTTSVSVKLTPIFGITIPAIIQIGESNTETSLSDLSLTMQGDTLPIFKLTFNCRGNMSVYGDLSIDYVSPDGKATQVGLARGIAVYTPNKQRHFTLALDSKSKVNFRTGKLIATYKTQPDAKSEILAESELILQ